MVCVFIGILFSIWILKLNLKRLLKMVSLFSLQLKTQNFFKDCNSILHFTQDHKESCIEI